MPEMKSDKPIRRPETMDLLLGRKPRLKIAPQTQT